jgi:hypothetical protein
VDGDAGDDDEGEEAGDDEEGSEQGSVGVRVGRGSGGVGGVGVRWRGRREKGSHNEGSLAWG